MDDGDFDQLADGRASEGRLGAVRHSRVEVIRAGERRRRWSRDEKAQITSESFMPGASVSDVARRHGMSLGLLHHWRRLARQSVDEVRQSFVPILQAEAPSTGQEERRPDVGVIEIEFCGASIRLRGGVDRAALASVLAAVRRA